MFYVQVRTVAELSHRIKMSNIQVMRMSQGVEWGIHVLLTLTWLDSGAPVATTTLATSYDLPSAYLNKQLQALVKAGLLESLPGARGGFRLARPAEQITLMDVVTAIEGPDEAFRCTEIRRNGAGADLPGRFFTTQCAVHASMQRAELAWRRALAERSIADVRDEAEQGAPGLGAYVRSHAVSPGVTPRRHPARHHTADHEQRGGHREEPGNQE